MEEREQIEKQPKDYETFEEFLNSGYDELNAWGRLTYFLQDHVWKAIFIGSIVGYLTGVRFGIFW